MFVSQAIGVVNDYNPLMKDFPINDLLSATELDRIRLSVQVIRRPLNHFANVQLFISFGRLMLLSSDNYFSQNSTNAANYFTPKYFINTD